MKEFPIVKTSAWVFSQMWASERECVYVCVGGAEGCRRFRFIDKSSIVVKEI